MNKLPQSGCTHRVALVTQGCVQPYWGYFECYWKIYLFFKNKANNGK